MFFQDIGQDGWRRGELAIHEGFEQDRVQQGVIGAVDLGAACALQPTEEVRQLEPGLPHGNTGGHKQQPTAGLELVVQMKQTGLRRQDACHLL